MIKQIKRHIWGTIPYLYLSIFNSKSEEISYRKYFKNHGYTRHPYSFAKKYLTMKVGVYMDEAKGLPYVLHRNSRNLYFPKDYSFAKVEKLYRSLLLEQDIESSHHYIDSVEELKGKTLLDVGSAEGLFTLDVIEKLNYAYLFEVDSRWIKALEATFEPWKDKIQIIAKHISNKDDAQSLSIDTFLKDKLKENIFLKMDIEGEERNALEGAANLFTNATNLEFAVCIYHRKDDKVVISSLLDKYDCTYFVRKGLLYYKHSFRPCLIRGQRFDLTENRPA